MPDEGGHTMSTTRAAAVAITTALALTACTSTNDPPASSTTSEPTTSSTTTDYKDEAVEAAKEWIEDDAGRSTTKNATPKMAEKRRTADAALKKAGIKVQGHDSVVSTEVGFADPASVTIEVCVTTDKKMMLKGKNVRTDRQGRPVKPGDRQLSTVRMTREVGTKDWRVADSEVRKISC